MALGASQRDILRMVVVCGMELAGVGILGGVASALVLTRAMSTLLFGVSPYDVTTFVGAPLFLAGVAMLASAFRRSGQRK